MTEDEYKELLHNKLCDVVDVIILYHNPCSIKDKTCYKGDVSDCCKKTIHDTNGQCKYLSDSGCTIRDLGCKTWFCWEVFDNLDSKTKRVLKTISIINRILMLTKDLPDLYNAEKDEYDYRDLRRYLDDDFS